MDSASFEIIQRHLDEMLKINLNGGTGDFKTGWEMAIEELECRLSPTHDGTNHDACRTVCKCGHISNWHGRAGVRGETEDVCYLCRGFADDWEDPKCYHAFESVDLSDHPLVLSALKAAMVPEAEQPTLSLDDLKTHNYALNAVRKVLDKHFLSDEEKLNEIEHMTSGAPIPKPVLCRVCKDELGMECHVVPCNDPIGCDLTHHKFEPVEDPCDACGRVLFKYLAPSWLLECLNTDCEMYCVAIVSALGPNPPYSINC